MDRAAYQQFADLEEDHFWFRGRRAIFFDLLQRHLPSDRRLRILEVGCGAGGFLPRLQELGTATGLELDLELATICLERTHAPTVCGDAYTLPFPDGSHDLVCLFDTIEHIPDEGKALTEIRRVLKPGGVVFFSVPAYQFLYANNDRVAHHQRRYTRRRLKRVVLESGFEARKVTYFNSFLFPAILPAVLAGKAKERVMGLKDPDHTNLSYVPPRSVNRVLAGVMSSERRLLRSMSFPTGHSLIGIFEKPAA